MARKDAESAKKAQYLSLNWRELPLSTTFQQWLGRDLRVSYGRGRCDSGALRLSRRADLRDGIVVLSYAPKWNGNTPATSGVRARPLQCSHVRGAGQAAGQERGFIDLFWKGARRKVDAGEAPAGACGGELNYSREQLPPIYHLWRSRRGFRRDGRRIWFIRT
jgi:hypothetical protein